MSIKLLSGRYELIEKIGDGGMAAVYKAKDRLLNRYVAIKILKPDLAKDSNVIESFRKESQAAAGLTHPNIVSIYDVGRENNIHYIVMELVDGQTLNEIIGGKPMDPLKVIDYTKQIASGLAFAHKNNIIHRDIKPHNILVTPEGVCKIADFGIAKALNEGNNFKETSDDMIMGSVHYFSPEQARGGYVDAKSDIYSLGIVMYEMLTGNVPFDGDSPVSIALMHINEEMLPPSKVVNGISPGLEEIVLKAAAKYQVDRFADADEMISELEKVEISLSNPFKNQGMPAAGPHNGGEEEERRRAAAERERRRQEEEEKKKKRTRLIIIIIIAAILAAAAIFFVFARSNAEVEAPNLVGMTYEQAEDLAKEKGLEIRKGDEVYSDDYDPGLIVSQSPGAKTKVKKGKSIKVNISKGVENGSVPDVIGKSESDARKALEDAGFKVGEIKEEESEGEAGIVLKQDPAGGSSLKKGEEVGLTISKEIAIQYVKMPGLIGKSLEDAKQDLETAGLHAGNIGSEYSSEYGEDVVMSQQYERGAQVEEGSYVDIVISKGSKSNSVSIQIDYSAAANDTFTLTVESQDMDGTKTVIGSQQREKSNGGETVSVSGRGAGTVIVYFDGEIVRTYDVDFDNGTYF